MTLSDFGVFLQPTAQGGWIPYVTDSECIQVMKGEPQRFPHDALDEAISLIGKIRLDEVNTSADILESDNL